MARKCYWSGRGCGTAPTLPCSHGLACPQVAERQVMAQKAYILFYLKRQPCAKRAPLSTSNRSVAMAAAPSPSPTGGSAPGAAAPAAAATLARRQDVQQPVRLDGQRGSSAATPALAPGIGSKKRKHSEAATDSLQQQQRNRHAVRLCAAEADEQQQLNGRIGKSREQQQDGRTSKKQRHALRQHAAAHSSSDAEVPFASPLPR